MKNQIILDYCKQFNLSGIANHFENIIIQASEQQISYFDCLVMLFEKEAEIRDKKAFLRGLKAAKLPASHNLDLYDNSFENGMNKTKMNQLRELNWLDQIYNIVLMRASGVGKTYLGSAD